MEQIFQGFLKCKSKVVVMMQGLNMCRNNLPSVQVFCLFDFESTSHQQSFSYIGSGLPGLNQH